MARGRLSSLQLHKSFVQNAGMAGSLRLETRNQEVARPRVKENPGLPEAFTVHFRSRAGRHFGTGMPGRFETSCRLSIPTRKGFLLFGFGHGHTKKLHISR